MPDPDDLDLLVADALDDVSARRARGESPAAHEYRERLGPAFDSFVRVLTTSDFLGQTLEPAPAERLPRAFGPYTLTRELGRGASGVVYDAVHGLLKRRTAVKILHHVEALDATAVMRFQRETMALASVQHPNIVPIYEAGTVDGQPYSAMALVEGEALSGLARQGRLPPPRELAARLADVADALATMHRAGLLHRDVKPANILVKPDGTMVLADFGHVRLDGAQSLTASGQALGTLLYMSPEQLQGHNRDVDARSDVYSLGATLYEALVGAAPFRADGWAALVYQVLHDRPQAPSARRADVPPGLEAVALKALEKGRDDRYASALEMRDDLRRFAEGRAVVGAPVGRGVRVARAVARRWIPLSAAAAVLAAGSVVWLRRPASLEVLTFPDQATLSVDGEPRGQTPLGSLRLAPGRHVVRAVTPGFADAEAVYDLGPGEDLQRVLSLVLLDPRDAASVARLLRAHGIERAPLEVGAVRAGSDVLTLAYPAGDVRLADLDELAFDLRREVAALTLPTEGIAIDFTRVGPGGSGGGLLGTVHVKPTSGPVRLPVPEAVRRALSVGDTVAWGLRAGAHVKGLTTAKKQPSFTVVADVVGARLAALERALADQPAGVRAEARVRVLLGARLFAAAARAAEAFAEAEPASAVAWALCGAAYRGLGLLDGPRADAVWQRWQAFRDDERAAAAGTAPAPR